MKKRQNIIFSIVTICLTFFLFIPVFKVYLFSPNTHMYAFGGDALTIYYDIQYHVCYGSGTMFHGMNYPFGEMIFLTDAQGALTMVLQWLNQFFPICDNVIGIINFLNAISVLIASWITFYVFRSIGASLLVSVIFSPFIILLSPQIFRLGGHFGLAYLFVIPLMFYYIINTDEKPKLNYLDVFIFFVLLFFTFNNPYLGFIGGALLILASIFRWVLKRNDLGRIKSAVIGLLPLIITFVYFRIFDIVDDRIIIQWGNFSYQASPKGFVGAKGSLVSDIFKAMGIEYNLDSEVHIYLGLVSFIVIVMSIILLALRNYHSIRIKFNDRVIAIIVPALILYLYASGFFFLPFDADFVEDELGFLLMFKAIARLGWPFYFAISIVVVLFIDTFYRNVYRPISLPIVLLLAVIWNWDLNVYVKPYFKDKINDNFFSVNKSKEMLDILKGNNINIHDFQCILSLPKIMTWTDNFLSDVNWSAQYYSMLISKSSGLPLLNAMLSRMSIGQTAEKIELLANPLVYKSIVEKLPNKKDILIVLGADYPPLSTGEVFLLEASDTLYYNPKSFSLFRLKVDDINSNQYLAEARKINCSDSNHLNEPIVYKGFNEGTSDVSYFGSGAQLMDKGSHLLLDTVINSAIVDSCYFSAWTKFDHLKYGIGFFNVLVFDSLNNQIFNEKPDTRKSNEIHDSWIKTEVKFPSPHNAHVKIEFESNRQLFIDELMIRRKNQTIVLCQPDGSILVDGYKIVPPVNNVNH